MKTPILLALAFLLCAPTLRAQTATFIFRVPLEIAAHGFSLKQEVFDPGTNQSNTVTRPVTYAGINDPTFGASAYLEFSAQVGTDENSNSFWLDDTLTAATTSYWSPTDPPQSPVVSPTWYDSSGHPNSFFALGSVRGSHTFCLKSNTGIVFPVQSGPLLSLAIPNGQGGTTQTAYALFNAWAQVPSHDYYGTSFQLFDLSVNEAAPADTANLANPSVNWTPQTGGLPTVPVRIVLGDAEAGNHFDLHTASGSLQHLVAAPGQIAGVDHAAVVQGIAGFGDTVWLVRSDGVASPAAPIAQVGNVITDWAGSFPANYVPSWASIQFRIGGARAGHSFTVRHANGVRVPFSISPSGTATTGHVTTPDGNGQPVDRSFDERYVDVDQKQGWTLFDETNSEDLGAVASAGDGPGAWHVPPPAGKISLNIPDWRKGHALILRNADGDHPVTVVAAYAVEGNFLTGMRYSLQGTPQARTYAFRFVPALADANPALPFTIVDGSEVFDCGAGERSPAEWYGPPEPLTLTLNASRWTHQLYVRHFDGTQFPMQRSNLQGGWFLNAQGQGAFSSFGIFEGLAWRQPLFDYAVFDRTTSELATANTVQLAGWGSDNTDTDLDGLSDWYELLIGTIPVLRDTDGDLVNDRDDYFPLDPTRSAWGPNVNDHTPPTITLTAPAGGTLTP